MPAPRPAARTPPQRLPRFRTLDLSPMPGGWQPLGHGMKPPTLPAGFSPPRFSPQQQAANPSQPMTRLVKDVLRVGRWKIGSDSAGRPQLWDVTPAVLVALATSHQRATARGVAMNLTKSHGDLRTGIVPTDELICPIDEMIVSGNGTLWVSCYVTPQQARYLMNPACKVSPGIWDDWIDGLGNRYATKMLHVAVTDHPVIPGQGPFVTLANRLHQNRKTLANGTTRMDFQTLKQQIDSLLLALSGGSVSLPTDCTDKSICRDLQIVMDSLGIDAQNAQNDAAAGIAQQLAASGVGMANRSAGKPNPRALFNPNRRRPSDQQCKEAAKRLIGNPRRSG